MAIQGSLLEGFLPGRPYISRRTSVFSRTPPVSAAEATRVGAAEAAGAAGADGVGIPPDAAGAGVAAVAGGSGT